LYHFIWGDVCDWYIEAVKPTVETSAGQQRVLASVLDVSLRLLHPSMPFITERLWEALNDACPERGVERLQLSPNELLVKAAWPCASESLRDPEAEAAFERVRELVTAIRELRTQCQVSPKQTVEVSVKTEQPVEASLIEALANAKLVEVGAAMVRPADAAAAVRPMGEIYLHYAVDPDAERQRLAKRLAELDKSIAAFRGRLANKGYTDKAPAHLVQQTRDQLAQAEAEHEQLSDQLAAL
jgi:valyl-tRNA synthetase